MKDFMEKNSAKELLAPFCAPISSIHNVKFSSREIDILACIVGGKTPKLIASILSLSPRTVENYIYNITQKLACNSREALIGFIEKSDEIFIIKEHYATLMVQAEFEKTLKEISKFNQKPFDCLLIDEEAEGAKKPFVYLLQKHLKLAGLSVAIKTQKEFESFLQGSVELSDAGYIICVESQSLLARLQREPKLISSSLQNMPEAPKKILYLALKKGNHTVPLSFSPDSTIDVIREENYYLLTFEVLKKLLPHINIENIILDFKKKYETIPRSHNRACTPIPSSKQIVESKENSTQSKVNALITPFLKRKAVYGVSAFLVIGFLGVGFLKLRGNQEVKEKNSIQTLKQSPGFIRSDLILPMKSAFLDRSELISQIDATFKGGEEIQSTALVGIGGAGKTTMARQYAHQQQANVIWEINAETQESLKKSFENLAQALLQNKKDQEILKEIKEIKNTMEREDSLLQFVKGCLKSYKNWLLIYDNVEDFDCSQKYFPKDSTIWGRGQVLLTTRDKNIQNHKLINSVVLIGELDRNQKFNFFIKLINGKDKNSFTDSRKEEVKNFLENIPSFPLDISLAADYLRSTNITFSQYLKNLLQNTKNFVALQTIILKESGDYTRTRGSIVTLTLKQLMNTHKDFKDLLLFTSFLDSQDIPRDFFVQYKGTDVVDNFIYHLKKYSLITNEASKISFGEAGALSFHRTIQKLTSILLLNSMNEKEKNAFMQNIISVIKSLYEINSEKDFSKNLLFIPHLNALKENLEKLNLPTHLTEKNKFEVFFMLGYIHYKNTNDHILTKEYFSKALEINQKNLFLSKKNLAIFYKDIGNNYIYLEDLRKGMHFCKKSIELCEKQRNSGLLTASNLDLIGVAYSQENNFEKAKEYFEEALNVIHPLEKNLKKKIEVIIYKHLAWLYSKTYLNRAEAYNAVKYAQKSLEILNAASLFYNTLPKKPLSKDERDSLNEIVRYKEGLGYVYCRLGKYEEAQKLGFREAQYIIECFLDKKFSALLSGYISLGIGEVFLRKGDLNKAEFRFTESIRISEKLIGGCDALQAKTYRAETRIRLGKLQQAYEDCLSVFKMKKNISHSYFNLMYYTCFYHAAVIKLKQGDLEKSIKHFSEFFQHIQPFCKSFLDASAYNTLKEKHTFTFSSCRTGCLSQDIKQYHKQCIDIFSAIYGSSHPFVQAYVLRNYAVTEKGREFSLLHPMSLPPLRKNK